MFDQKDPHFYDHTAPIRGSTGPLGDWTPRFRNPQRDSLRMVFALIGIPLGAITAVGTSIPMLFVGALLGAVIGYFLGWGVSAAWRFVFVTIPRAIHAALKGPREPTL